MYLNIGYWYNTSSCLSVLDSDYVHFADSNCDDKSNSETFWHNKKGLAPELCRHHPKLGDAERRQKGLLCKHEELVCATG